MPDMTFYPRVIRRLEPKVPMALVEEKEIAKALERRIANHSNIVELECTLECILYICPFVVCRGWSGVIGLGLMLGWIR